MKIKDGTWVFVADGSRAIVLQNNGTPMKPQFTVVRSHTLENSPTRELGRDKPGRMPDASQPHRSSMEAPDLHEREEERFLRAELEELSADLSHGRFKSLVVIAPPVALGRLREAIDEHLNACVVASFDKGLAQMPVQDIAKAIAKFPEP